jgi:hypothetical protein
VPLGMTGHIDINDEADEIDKNDMACVVFIL